MKDNVSVDELVEVFLRPKSEDESPASEQWEDFSLVCLDVNGVNIVDLKGKAFKFPGSYSLSLIGDSVYLRAK